MGIFDFLKTSKDISIVDLDGGTGRSETYYDNGKGPLMCHKYLIGFKLHGKEQFFYRNGQIKSDWNWKDNKKEGIHRHYYKNGQVMLEQPWENGEVHGLSKFYHENGQLSREENYENGKMKSKKCWDKKEKEIE